MSTKRVKKGIRGIFVKILIGICATAILGVGAFFAFNTIFAPEVAQNQITAGYTSMLEPPKGGNPNEHTGLENLSYMAYNLRHAKAYSVEAYGTVTAAGQSQTVRTYKDYSNGVMVVEDFATSNSMFLVNSATQSCFVNNRALWRISDPANIEGWNGRDTAESLWEQTPPSNHSYKEYMEVYGLPCDEFSIYVLNEKTIGEVSQMVDNGNGTFTQTFYPTQEAAQYYMRRMKTMGGLGDYPVFESIEIVYTFDSNWNILKSKTTERYSVKIAGLSFSGCLAVTEQVYSYDENKVNISAYDNYFSKYVTQESVGDIGGDKELTITDYLLSAFSPILNGGAQLSLDIDVQDDTLSSKTFQATLYANVDLQGMDLQNVDLSQLKLDVRADLAGIKVWFTDNVVYLQLEDKRLSLSVSSLTSILGVDNGDTERTSSPAVVDEDGETATESSILDGLLEQISAAQLTVEGNSASLSMPLSIGEVNLPLYFAFNVDGDNISLDYIQLNDVALGDYTVSLVMAYDDGEVLPALTADEKAVAVDVTDYVTSIVELTKAEAFNFTVDYQNENVSVNADATFNLADKTLAGALTFTGGEITLNGTFLYQDGFIYLDIVRAGDNLKLKLNGKEILSALGIDLSASVESLDVNQLIQKISVDWKLLKENFTLTADKLTALLPITFDENKLDIQAEITPAGLITANLLGVGITFQKSEKHAVIVNESQYADGTTAVKNGIDLIKGGSIDLNGEINLVIDKITAKLTLEEVNVRFNEGLTVFAKAELEVANTVHNLYISYVDEELSIAYGAIGVSVKANEFDSLATSFKTVYTQLSGKVEEAVENGTHEAEEVLSLSAISAIFSTEEINNIINTLTVANGENGGLAVALQLLSGNAEIVYENEILGINLDKVSLSGMQISLGLTANAGDGDVGKMPAGVSYLRLSELQTVCDYILDAYALVNRVEWNVNYVMSVYNEHANYADYGYVQYNVSGNLQVALAKTVIDEEGVTSEKPFEASISVNVIPTNLAVDLRSYCINITVKDGWLYIKASYYSDETNDNYNPLYMKGELSQMAGIIDTVTTVLGYDLSFIGDILNPFQNLVGSEPSAEEAKWVISDMFGGISVDERGITLQVKPDKIYNVEGLNNLALNILRAGEGAEALFSLSLKNIYFATEPRAWLDATLTQTLDGVAVIAPENSESYIDISSINTLLNSILDSFLNVTDNKLDLKDGYYFAGAITAEILGYEVNFNVKLNVLYEDGNITLNASIAGKKQSLLFFSLIDSDFETLLTLNLSKGIVQMQKTINDKDTTYRSVTLNEFGKDYWSQISYATNLGSDLAGIVQDQINKPSEDTGIDEKIDIGSYLKGYTYADSAYKVTLNGKNFATFLGDMSLTFTHDETGKIKNISGSVSIYVNLTLNLDYENTTKSDGNYSLMMKDVTDTWRKEGYEMTLLTGKNTSQNSLTDVAEYRGEVTLRDGENQTHAEIVLGAPMSALNGLENTEKAQFMGWFTKPDGAGERVTANTVDSGFAGATFYAYWVDYVNVNLDGDGGTLSANVIKAIPENLFDELSKVTAHKDGAFFVGWRNQAGERITADNAKYLTEGQTVYAEYQQTALTFNSDVVCSFNGLSAESTKYSIPNEAGAKLPTVSKAGYKFVAWVEETATGYTLVTDDEGLNAGDMQNKTYHAVWVKDSVAITITEGKRSLGFWTIKGTYAGGGFASGKSAEIANALGGSESAQVIYKLSKDGTVVSDTLNSGNAIAVSGGSFSKSGMSSWNCKTGTYYGGATVQVTYTLGGVSVTIENTAYNN